ncbi:MAG: hemerythrin domain-containing protein [Methanoculleus sp.]|nr:hemerythrin domain-containing protein [Methanoculleus sp.]
MPLILSELASKGVSGREQEYNPLKENLMPHVIGEEQVPRLKEVTETRDIAFEAIEEHSAVKTLLSQLDGVSTSDEEVWVAKLKVIQENLQHHIREEEGIIFVEMQRRMSNDELSSLNSQYEEAKRSVMAVAAR